MLQTWLPSLASLITIWHFISRSFIWKDSLCSAAWDYSGRDKDKLSSWKEMELYLEGVRKSQNCKKKTSKCFLPEGRGKRKISCPVCRRHENKFWWERFTAVLSQDTSVIMAAFLRWFQVYISSQMSFNHSPVKAKETLTNSYSGKND